ncbi:MAG: Tat pathway signal protein [Campylobacteraceae bacterium]|nr:Tat pathway signal protein [Campylobacteraceae bacterium]
MQEKRRVFLKKTLTAGVVTAVGVKAGLAASVPAVSDDNGVVVGKSNKKEILYRQTKEWELYYRRSY